MRCPRCNEDNIRKYRQYEGIISYLCKKCGRIVLEFEHNHQKIKTKKLKEVNK